MELVAKKDPKAVKIPETVSREDMLDMQLAIYQVDECERKKAEIIARHRAISERYKLGPGDEIKPDGVIVRAAKGE